MNYRLRDGVPGLLVPPGGRYDGKGFPDSGHLLTPSQFAARMESQREGYAPQVYSALMNLVDSIFAAASRLHRWSHPALVERGRSLTYAELRSTLSRFGGLLLSLKNEAVRRNPRSAASCFAISSSPAGAANRARSVRRCHLALLPRRVATAFRCAARRRRIVHGRRSFGE